MTPSLELTPVELRIENVDKAWSDRPVLRGLDLRVAAGEIVAVLGPSACGKTTLLRIVAGLETPDRGQVFLDGADVTDTAPADRGLGMVFQHHALLPHLSVAENIGFGLAARRRPAREVVDLVTRSALLMGCDALLTRSPSTLSGGERQRVALARALVRQPRIVLLDEPLSSLDVHVRSSMRTELRTALVSCGSTVLHVTHDQAEAFAVADRVAVLDGGSVQQIGTTDDLYDRPAHQAVAAFIGSPRMNFVDVIPGARTPFAVAVPTDLADRRLVAGVRPSDVLLTGSETTDVSGVVVAVEIADEIAIVHIDVGGVPLRATLAREARPRVHDVVGVAVDSRRLHLFDGDTGAALRHPS